MMWNILTQGCAVMQLSVILGLAVLLSPGLAGAWELVDEKQDQAGNSYVIYRRDKPGSALQEYKLVTVFDAPVKQVVEAVRAMATDPAYVMKGATRRMVAHPEPDTYYMYSRHSAPMVSDRDITAKLTLTFEPTTQSYRWQWVAVSDKGPPPQDGVVRIQSSRSSWVLSPAEKHKTLGEYQSHSDPGGSIPAWVANRAMTSTLEEMHATLRRIIRERKKK